MPDQIKTGTVLYVPLDAARNLLSEYFSPGLTDEGFEKLKFLSLRLPTEGLENLEPLLEVLEDFKTELAAALEDFTQATAGFKAEAGAAVEKIIRVSAPSLILLTEFVSLLGRQGLLPGEARESLEILLSLVTRKIRQLDTATAAATALKTVIDAAAEEFRQEARGEAETEETKADDAEKLARAQLEAYLNEILWLLRRDTLESDGKTPLLACDPDQLPVWTKAAIRERVGSF